MGTKKTKCDGLRAIYMTLSEEGRQELIAAAVSIYRREQKITDADLANLPEVDTEALRRRIDELWPTAKGEESAAAPIDAVFPLSQTRH